MTLDQIETPFERRRAIRYGKDGNKAVRHWYNVRPVGGSIYMGEPMDDKHGMKYFDLFVFFPNVKDGLYLTCMVDPSRHTQEEVMESVGNRTVENKDAFTSDLDKRIEQGAFIGNADIEFVRQWDYSKSVVYAEYRKARLIEMESKQRQRRMEQEVEDAKEKAAEAARLQAERAKYLGWSDTMSPMRFGKADAVLGSLVRSDGKLMTRREFVISAVKAGWMPEKKDGVTSWYGSRWNRKESKPRTEYRLVKEKFSYKVTKTEFYFATYIVEHKEEI